MRQRGSFVTFSNLHSKDEVIIFKSYRPSTVHGKVAFGSLTLSLRQ